MIQSRFTHYAYLCGPNGVREPTSLFDLSSTPVENRQAMIHNLMKNGELLCKCPHAHEIYNIKDLRRVLKWIEEKKRNKRNDEGKQ